MKKTFYVATSWTNKDQAAEVADYLKATRGMRWANEHDWTKVEVGGTSREDPMAPLKSYMDISGAVSCDLFVILLKDPLTVGCHAELGARVGAGKEAHLVRQGADSWHLFHDHPNIVHHDTVEDFIRYTFGA